MTIVEGARPGDRPRDPGAGTFLGRIGTRAVLVSLLMFGVVGLLTATVLMLSDRQAAAIGRLAGTEYRADRALDTFATEIHDFSAGMTGVIAGVFPPGPTANRMLRSGERVSRSFAEAERWFGAELDPIVLSGARDMAARMDDLAKRIYEAFAANRRAAFVALQEDWLDVQSTFLSFTRAARGVQARHNETIITEATALAERARIVVLGVGAIGVLGCLLILFVLMRLIARPLTLLARAMEGLSRGRAELEVPGSGRGDQVGEMARAVLVFRENLLDGRRLGEQALEGARQTAVATTQASDAIGQVSDGAMTQLSELRGLGEALGHSTDAIREVGRITQSSHERTEASRRLLSESLSKIGALVEVVEAVGEDTARVTRIASTIGKVATQTNILAINAAIEAARAGEHGRGLGVVAEEVRGLAVNTEALAQEIGEVVLRAGERAREGGRSAAEVGAAMDELERLVAESARLSGATAIAMEQQQVTVSSITERVEVLTRIGQSNAAAAEEITVTMIDLARLAAQTRAAVENVAAGAGEERGPGHSADVVA